MTATTTARPTNVRASEPPLDEPTAACDGDVSDGRLRA
jgi:hypothetical protein